MATRRTWPRSVDVLAWLTTLANICEIDLETAIHRKYIEDGGPSGTK